MERVDLPDVTLAVRKVGDGPALPLIWGHGLSSSMEGEDELGLVDWHRAAPDRTVWRYDARGHGESGSTPDPVTYTWDRLAADQLALADALGVDRYVATGASMGCATALFAALAAPERIERLVLVIPPTAWETRAAQTDMYGIMARLLDEDDLDTLLAGVDTAAVPDPFADDEAWSERSRRRLLEADRPRLANVLRGAALADLPPPERLRDITAPALVLAWTGDPGHPVASAEALHDLLPDTRLHVASDAAALGTWSDLLREFLRG
ncbi:MAG: alpha/beta hydrolase [Actinomycetota bacterium]